jgi:hypothetical protein
MTLLFEEVNCCFFSALREFRVSWRKERRRCIAAPPLAEIRLA